jgi:hypothetical protein
MSDDYKNFFYNKENLESIYNILKGDDKELSKKAVKNYISKTENCTYKSKIIKKKIIIKLVRKKKMIILLLKNFVKFIKKYMIIL